MVSLVVHRNGIKKTKLNFKENFLIERLFLHNFNLKFKSVDVHKGYIKKVKLKSDKSIFLWKIVFTRVYSEYYINRDTQELF